jgi:hypothetical protein
MILVVRVSGFPIFLLVFLTLLGGRFNTSSVYIFFNRHESSDVQRAYDMSIFSVVDRKVCIRKSWESVSIVKYG